MNELMTKENTTLTTINDDFMFGMENMISQDVKLPKILLMQAMSKMTQDDAVGARQGEIRDSAEKKLLAKKDGFVQIIPFYFTNHWMVQKEVNGKMEFHKIEDRTGNDANRQYETIVEGVRYTNDKLLNIFCIIASGNLQVPYQLGLRRASLKNAGQSFLQKVQLLRAINKAPAHVVFNLGVKMVENDKGSWFAFTLDTAKDADGKDLASTPEQLAAAIEHYKTVKNYVVDGKLDLSTTDEDSSEGV